MENNISWLKKRLNGEGRPVIMDGGMGTQLEKAGVPMDSKVWSGRAMLSHPQMVRQAHEEFIKAGAEVIITNTFSTARHMLEPGGLGDQVKQINYKAVELAQRARDNVAEQPVAIVGSICEWASTDEPKWHKPESVSVSVREQAELLAEAGVDLIALEMCEQTQFSIAATEAVLEIGLPVWIGVSAMMHKGRELLTSFNYKETDFENHIQSLSDFPVAMINVMHTPASDVDMAMEVVKKHWQGPIGVYPESGYFIMPNWQFIDVMEVDEFANYSQHWIKKGARLVGGCCGLGPEHIATLRQTLN